MKLRVLPNPEPKLPPLKKPVSQKLLLCEAPIRTQLQLVSVHLPHPLRHPLEEMGLIPGCYVNLLYTDHKGTVVLDRNGESFILGRRETRHIKVVTHKRAD